MQQAETIVLLLGLVAALVVIAQKITLPYPVVLVLAGLALSFVPRLPEVKLNPDIVFYFFLPPLIYPAALFTSWRDFRRNLRPILLLAIGLVLTTMMGIAWVAHSLIPSIPWAAAFALGAIVSPPDAVAATSVIRRLPVPHQIRVVLEGESLVNDATALVALQFAVVALMTGTFSLGQATARFVIVALGGTALGLLIGFIARWMHRHLDDPPVQITISLLTPLAAYLLAERIHVSGILAVVTAGIYLGWHGPIILSSRFRLPAYAVWEMVVFLLNGFVFITIGLQLPRILRELRGESLGALIDDALLVSGAAVMIHKLGIKEDGSTDEEERKARVEANKAALSLVESLANNGDFSADTTSRLRAEYDDRLAQLELCAQSDENCGGGIATPQYQGLQQQALDVERQTIIRLRNQHVINDDALRRIQRDLDLAEARLTGS